MGFPCRFIRSRLVKDTAVFAFRLGTAPDSLLIPEPVTLALLGLGGLLLRKRK